MATETTDNNELLAAVDEAVFQLQDLLSSLDESNINTIPYKDSWTAGQLVQHVAKSTDAMAKAMSIKSKPADRDPGERIPQLKAIFLDFNHKLSSPDFIIPDTGPFVKQASSEALKASFEEFKKNASHANLTELVEGLPLGPITKLEIFHFVQYHTRRHVHQMRKIVDAINK